MGVATTLAPFVMYICMKVLWLRSLNSQTHKLTLVRTTYCVFNLYRLRPCAISSMLVFLNKRLITNSYVFY